MLEQWEAEERRAAEAVITPNPTDEEETVTNANGKPIRSPKRNRTIKQIRINRPAFKKCLAGGYPTVTCGLEMVLLISIVLLFIQELMQFYALGFRQYFREFENLVELAVLVLSSLGLAFQGNLDVLKWISAFGICLAYLELIFLMGR